MRAVSVTYELRLADAVVARIRALAKDSEDGRETGGILLGHTHSRERVIDVVEAGDAGPKAERRPDFFLRDLEHARDLAAAAWGRERGEWVGEWHTHPVSGPLPSVRDLVTYADLLARDDLSFEIFVSIIVTPHRQEGWEKALLTPWLTRWDGGEGTLIIETARRATGETT